MKQELIVYFYGLGRGAFDVKCYEFEYLLGTMRRFREKDGTFKHPNEIERCILDLCRNDCRIYRDTDGKFKSGNMAVSLELEYVNRFPFTWCYMVTALNKWPGVTHQLKSGNDKVKHVVIGKVLKNSRLRLRGDEIMWCLQDYTRRYA
jgi:hypothetical protein